MRSKLYRLNLFMAVGPLYCTEESCTMTSTPYRLNLSMSGGAIVLYRAVPVQ